MTKRDKIVLLNVLDTIEEMQGYCQKERCMEMDDFMANAMLKRAITMCMISISEIIRGFSDEFRNENPDIDINQFKAMRNIAAHNYGAINFSMLWGALTIDIVKLQKQLELVLANYELFDNDPGTKGSSKW